MSLLKAVIPANHGWILKNFIYKLRDVDRALFRVLFRLKWAPATVVMRWFTLAGTAGALWGFITALAFLFTGFKAANLIVPWGSIALSWFLAEGTKYLFDRRRPYIHDTSIAPLIKTPSSSSFPSGHSATAGAGALSLSVIYPTLAVLILPAGLLTMFSRIYLGVHYPIDVMTGAFIGLLTAAGFLLVW
jgi:undecaprenyl-diphosphatase